jgi:hypothetical protein
MERAAAEWKYGQRHKVLSFHDGTFPADIALWSDKRTDDTPYHYLDGVTFWVADRDLAPHDHFLGGAEHCDDCNPEEVTDGHEA